MTEERYVNLYLISISVRCISKQQGRQTGGGGVGGFQHPSEFWMGGLNTCLHRNSKNLTFYSVKILKCESFLIALLRNSKREPFYSVKFLEVGLF